ncbi:uncharacterized protein [Rutidosis leptorrhynchoides]|uniref:uncharacterized protein n=1 Tax=Rutidosis leptorrhynchoides TaxID=125765 RepID=UPI003A9A243D
MSNNITNNNLQHDDQGTEVLDTLSLIDFPLTHHHDHQNLPSSSVVEDFFEFFGGGLSDEKMMSDAEDIIFCGKLVPINEQQHRMNSPQQIAKQHKNDQQVPYGCRRSRSESTSKNKTTTANSVIRNSRSLDYNKLKRNSSMTSEQTHEVCRDRSGRKSSSSRWYVLFFGLVKVPPSGIDLRDMKNRHVRRVNSDLCDKSTVNQRVDHKTCSSRVLGFLSCKSSVDDVVTTSLRYVPQI